MIAWCKRIGELLMPDNNPTINNPGTKAVLINKILYFEKLQQKLVSVSKKLGLDESPQFLYLHKYGLSTAHCLESEESVTYFDNDEPLSIGGEVVDRSLICELDQLSEQL